MEERTVGDYFVVAGLPDTPEAVEDDYGEGLAPNLKNIEPITDITVIFPSLQEEVPRGFACVETTPSGYPANLNSGSLRTPEVYLCYRRGRDKPPLVDIGVMYDGKERLLPDAEVVISTPSGKPANVNNTNARTLLTFRRASESMPCNELVVTDVCVILMNKGERPPHAFCLINKNLNKGVMGSDVYVCYKKSMSQPAQLQYKAEVLLRYPPIDRRGFPFPTSVAMFCLPMCATIEAWPSKASQPRPVFSTFVLTVADGSEKIYGSAVTFYEKYPVERLSEEQLEGLGMGLEGQRAEKTVHVNKCIAILSHYPFFDTFRTFLTFLQRRTLSGPQEVPIERYISHLLEEVPLPGPRRPHILMQLSLNQSVLMSHPHDSPLPKSGASFRLLLSNLGPENCLLVLLLVLTEQKLLIHSLRPDVLTAIAEAVSVLVFPFYWQCPYIPLCPLALCAVLQAPVPFLVGVDSRFFDLYEPPPDVTCIDLDTTSITLSEDKRQQLSLKLVPKKPARLLKHTLEILQVKIKDLSKSRGQRRGDAVDIDTQYKKEERVLEVEIQEAFLRFMTGVLKGYRGFLLPIMNAPTAGATDASSLFDFHGFLRSRDKSYHKFYTLVLRTQMFIRFIEERSFVSDMDTGLAFFDECIDKVEQDDSDTLKLVDLREENQSERTVFVMPPEPSGLPPNKLYEYGPELKLNETLFGGSARAKDRSLERVLQGSDMQASPGSPVARRTKQEIKSAKKKAEKYSEQPVQWAKYLLSTTYTLWFIHLPSYVSMSSSKHMALCLAYEMLVRMAKSQLQPADEVCYRVVMQLCGLYSQPVVAVKVLMEMRKCRMTPNAITYGFYNKAVLESRWPSSGPRNPGQLMWSKLRNVIQGVAQFRTAGGQRRLSLAATDEVDRLSTGSGGSLESQSAKAVSPAKLHPPTDVPTMSARMSASSDVGYGSMQEQEASKVGAEVPPPGEPPGESKFWGKMGQSFDSWVKSSVSSIANVAALAADSSYNSPAGLFMANYRGDYGITPSADVEDEDEYENKFEMPQQIAVEGRSHRKLDFSGDETKSGTSLRHMMRSVSFGNDTDIMSKLRVAEGRGERVTEPRAHSEESNGSLETKVNQFYEPPASPKSPSASRDPTPVDVPQQVDLDHLSPSTSSPVRTPVTQNDPLGALAEDQNGPELELPVPPAQKTQPPTTQVEAGRECPKRTSSEGNIGHSQLAVAMGLKGKHNGGVDLSGTGPVSVKGFHRSSTLPNYASNLGGSNSSESTPTGSDKFNSASGANVVTSLTAFGSSLKSFSRYSPGRLSLRKAGNSLLESTLGNKKAEAFLEGFQQLKSVAAVTAKKKLDEFKEVINNSPATRNGPFGMRIGDDERSYDYPDIGAYEGAEPVVDQWASVSDSYLDQLCTAEPSSALGSTLASSTSQEGPSQQDTPLSSSTHSLLAVESLLSKGSRQEVQYPVALEVSMTTCSLCHNCSSLLFDEEIMAGWTAEDSNLNTKCPQCRKWEVPFLEVSVRDFRYAPLPVTTLGLAPSLESMGGGGRRMSLNPSLLAPPLPNVNQPCRKFSLNPAAAPQETYVSNNLLLPLPLPRPLSKSAEEEVPVSSQPSEVKSEVSEESSPVEDPLGVLSSGRDEAQEVSQEGPTLATQAAVEDSMADGRACDPIIVPYLSPLVLRKELENVLEHEGDSCLLTPSFVDLHPIIYWNMVWFFQRSNLTSHLKGLALHANSTCPQEGGGERDESWAKADHRHVLLRCMWDNPKFHAQFGLPLYVQWLRAQRQESGDEEPTLNPDTQRLMTEIVRAVSRGDMSLICSRLLHHYHKQPPPHYPTYRDILFLALVAGGKDALDLYGFGFDRDYRNAYSRLRNNDEYETMDRGDTPPSDTALFCRKHFTPLLLL